MYPVRAFVIRGFLEDKKKKRKKIQDSPFSGER